MKLNGSGLTAGSVLVAGTRLRKKDFAIAWSVESLEGNGDEKQMKITKQGRKVEYEAKDYSHLTIAEVIANIHDKYREASSPSVGESLDIKSEDGIKRCSEGFANLGNCPTCRGKQ